MKQPRVIGNYKENSTVVHISRTGGRDRQPASDVSASPALPRWFMQRRTCRAGGDVWTGGRSLVLHDDTFVAAVGATRGSRRAGANGSYEPAGPRLGLLRVPIHVSTRPDLRDPAGQPYSTCALVAVCHATAALAHHRCLPEGPPLGARHARF